MVCGSGARKSLSGRVAGVHVIDLALLDAAGFVVRRTNQARTHWLLALLKKNNNGRERSGRAAPSRPSQFRMWQAYRLSRRIGDSVSALETTSPQIGTERFARRGHPYARIAQP